MQASCDGLSVSLTDIDSPLSMFLLYSSEGYAN